MKRKPEPVCHEDHLCARCIHMATCKYMDMDLETGCMYYSSKYQPPPGYKLVRKLPYDCTCLSSYPNGAHYNKHTGKWKCTQKYVHWGYTKTGRCACIRKEPDDD